MATVRTASRKDANHNEIKKALEKVGAYVIDTHQLKNAFDMIVNFRGKSYIVEIKDGKKSPSARKLSEGEQICADKLNNVGVKYHIVESVDEAMQLIGI
jgi:hypothetical protein